MSLGSLPLRVEILFAALLALPCACATPGRSVAASGANPTQTRKNPELVELKPLVVTPTTADSISEICDRGIQQFQAAEFAAAERDLDLCVRADPAGANVVSALYHQAIALDQLGRLEASLDRFVDVRHRLRGDEPMAQAVAIRIVRLACHLERWNVARQYAELILSGARRLQPSEKVLLHGALALEAVARADDANAEHHVGHARNEIENAGLDAPGKISREIAGVYFALGELRRIRAERTTLEYSPKFASVLERRCELILAAQAAYSDAMRALDAHWSTMAGYRVGELYASLHRELMQIPAPPTAKTEQQRRLFEGAMRLRYSVLVQKALDMMKHTLTMAERTGENSAWVDRVKAARAELELQLQEEQRAIDAMHVSREALEAALKNLQNEALRKP